MLSKYLILEKLKSLCQSFVDKMTTTVSENKSSNDVHNNSGQVVEEEIKVMTIGDTVKQEDTTVILSTGITPDGIKYHVRRMKFEDIDEVLKVWKEIGLYEGTNTIQSFLTIDPEGFYVAVNEKDGKLIDNKEDDQQLMIIHLIVTFTQPI